MQEYRCLTLDPWGKAPRNRAPDSSSRFVCSYMLNLGVDTVEEAAFMDRSSSVDELWLIPFHAIPTDLKFSRNFSVRDLPALSREAIYPACSVERQRDDDHAATYLLWCLFYARVGHAWPTEMVHAGLLASEQFDVVVERLKRELDGNAAKAKELEDADIIKAAKELRLDPEPSGTNVASWKAKCPGGSHYMCINAALNQFGCGYCRRMGGPTELRQFMADRNRQK
jgi:hypothetical protein